MIEHEENSSFVLDCRDIQFAENGHGLMSSEVGITLSRSTFRDLVDVHSMSDLTSKLHRKIAHFGYKTFVIMRPPRDKHEARRFFRWSTWDPDMKSDWIESKRAFHEPAIPFICRTRRPYFSHEILARSTLSAKQRQTVEARQAFRLSNYLSVRIANGTGAHDYINFEGNDVQSDETARNFLWLCGMQLSAAVLELMERIDPDNEYDFSFQESQCIVDASDGLSVKEGAVQAGLHLDDYREHIRYACAKARLNRFEDLARIPRNASLRSKPNTPELTDREKHCLELASFGFTDHEIADRLYISHRTVNIHVANATKKLKAKSRTHGVRIALREGLIQ